MKFPKPLRKVALPGTGRAFSQVYAEIIPQQIVKLFRGSKVADIPVEQATKFELVINRRIAYPSSQRSLS
jgi:putative ABC transport system substrate-binding protein